MDLKEFTFRIVLLFIPGLIALMVFERLTIHKKLQPFFYVLSAMVFGLGAYLFIWISSLGLFPWFNETCLKDHLIFGLNYYTDFELPSQIAFWEVLQDIKRPLQFTEILMCCISAAIIACFAAFISNRKWLYRCARELGITKNSGEADVWGLVMSYDNTVYVTYRDLETDLMYDGWIQAFSEYQDITELYLRDVCIYRNTTSDFLYQTGGLYLKIDPKKVILEFRGIPISEQHKTTQISDYEQKQREATTVTRGVTEEGGGQSNASTTAPAAAAAAAPCESAAQQTLTS